MLVSRDVDWERWESLAEEHAAFDDLTPSELELRVPDLDEDERAALETAHWSSKIGGSPSFSQSTLRALSKRTGAVLPFLAQIGGDAAYDAYGYRFYLFGDVATGELSLTSQR